jgi:hypothetical protein
MVQSRRTRAAVWSGVLFLGAGCGGSGFAARAAVPPSTDAPTVPAPVAVSHDPALRASVVRSVAATSAARTARASISVTLTGVGDEALATGAYDVAGSGVVDLTNGDADLMLSVPLFDRLGGGGAIEQRIVGGVVYTRLPQAVLRAAGLAPSVWWLSIDPNRIGGLDPSALSQSQVDPVGQLGFLGAMSNDVRVVGAEQVRGVASTHYAATIDLGADAVRSPRTVALRAALTRLGSGIATGRLALDVWLDRSGRARRVVVTVPLDASSAAATPGPLGRNAMLRIQGDFYAFGAPLHVSAPAPNRVRPYSALRLAASAH